MLNSKISILFFLLILFFLSCDFPGTKEYLSERGVSVTVSSTNEGVSLQEEDKIYLEDEIASSKAVVLALKKMSIKYKYTNDINLLTNLLSLDTGDITYGLLVERDLINDISTKAQALDLLNKGKISLYLKLEGNIFMINNVAKLLQSSRKVANAELLNDAPDEIFKHYGSIELKQEDGNQITVNSHAIKMGKKYHILHSTSWSNNFPAMFFDDKFFVNYLDSFLKDPLSFLQSAK